MATTEFANDATELANLRSRALSLSALVTMELTMADSNLDDVFDRADRLVSLVNEMRIMGQSMLERQATGGAA